METYPIDWFLTAGTEYTPKSWQVLVIKKLGTDASSKVDIYIDKKYCGSIIDKVAPLYQDTTNILPLLDLGELFLVVPGDKSLKFEGSGTVRVVGELITLSPGETIPADLLARFREQSNRFVTYETGSVSLGTDVAWGAGSVITIYEKQLRKSEKFIFDGLVRVDQANVGTSPGLVAIQFYLDDEPKFNTEDKTGPEGIDMKAFLIDSGRLEYFTLAKWPIELLGDHKLTIKAKNISGGAITPPSGSSISLTVYLVGKYTKFVG